MSFLQAAQISAFHTHTFPQIDTSPSTASPRHWISSTSC